MGKYIPTGRPGGRPVDPRNLQAHIPVRLPEEHDIYVRERAEEEGIPCAEVIRELVAAGLAAQK